MDKASLWWLCRGIGHSHCTDLRVCPRGHMRNIVFWFRDDRWSCRVGVFAVSVEAVLYDFLLKSSDTVAQFAKFFEKNVNCCDFLKLDSQLFTEDTDSSGVFAFWI